MIIPPDHKCIDCGKSAKEVKFTINKPKDIEYVVNHCNRCLYKIESAKMKKQKKENRQKRITLIGKRISNYFKEMGSKEK